MYGARGMIIKKDYKSLFLLLIKEKGVGITTISRMGTHSQCLLFMKWIAKRNACYLQEPHFSEFLYAHIGQGLKRGLFSRSKTPS
jgi:hypothetical protein